jgi:uncharacterized protein YegL
LFNVREADANRRLCFFAVGVENANMNILRQIAPPERPPLLLNGLDWWQRLCQPLSEKEAKKLFAKTLEKAIGISRGASKK